MYKYFLILLSFSLVSLLQCTFSDRSEKSSDHSLDVDYPSMIFGESSFSERAGDCDNEEGNCLEINLKYPQIVEGNEEAGNRINAKIQEHLHAHLMMGNEKKDTLVTLENLTQDLIHSHEESCRDIPDFPQRWIFEITGKVLLSSSYYASVELSDYSYTSGAAHPNSYTNLMIFDTNSGKEISVGGIISNMDSLRTLAEFKFRKKRELTPEESFINAGFFLEDDQFVLPKNIGMKSEGLYFYYNPYEVASYAAGPTDFIITFEEMKGITKENFSAKL